MPKLFVEKSIEINAPASKVWEVLTKPDLIKEWVKEWWPDFVTLESDWKLGSPMHWKIATGAIAAEGKITAIKPCSLLSFSFKGGAPKPVNETFRLEEQGGRTMFMVSIGDFGDDPTMESYFLKATENWDRYFLPRIKELAERLLQVPNT